MRWYTLRLQQTNSGLHAQGGDNLDHKFITIIHIEKRSDAFETQPLSVEDEYNNMQTVRAYFILYRG